MQELWVFVQLKIDVGEGFETSNQSKQEMGVLCLQDGWRNFTRAFNGWLLRVSSIIKLPFNLLMHGNLYFMDFSPDVPLSDTLRFPRHGTRFRIGKCPDIFDRACSKRTFTKETSVEILSDPWRLPAFTFDLGCLERAPLGRCKRDPNRQPDWITFWASWTKNWQTLVGQVFWNKFWVQKYFCWILGPKQYLKSQITKWNLFECLIQKVQNGRINFGWRFLFYAVS